MSFNETFPKRLASKSGPTTATGCIEWLGHVDKRGYGRVRKDANRRISPSLAHRAVFEYAHGDIPEGMVVMHRCDNPRCINLEHLSLGRQADNVTDMIVKERHSWRVKTPWQKLSSQDALMVKRLRAKEMTQQKIADLMGVSRPLISMLLGGQLQYAL